MRLLRTFLTTLAVLCTISLNAQTKAAPDYSAPFATYADSTLEVDVYLPKDDAQQHYCIIYSYGGGFISNNQRVEMTRKFCRRLADAGYVVVASDYRLGLKGVKMKGKVSMIKPMRNAIEMAVEDIFKVTSYVLDNSASLKVRKDGIVLCGSSAGAMTSLQCDYELCNRSELAKMLPEDFRYAGIISFAGAIFSEEGKADYRVHSPAPTLLLHGMSDSLVEYDKVKLFNMRLVGSSDLAKRFAKFGWSYEIIRFVDEGHGVAMRMMENFDDVLWFLDNMVVKGARFEIDKTVYDKDYKRTSWDKMGPKALY